MLFSPRNPSRTFRIFSSAGKPPRVARRISRIMSSAAVSNVRIRVGADRDICNLRYATTAKGSSRLR